jgi:hypothetical protein
MKTAPWETLEEVAELPCWRYSVISDGSVADAAGA